MNTLLRRNTAQPKAVTDLLIQQVSQWERNKEEERGILSPQGSFQAGASVEIAGGRNVGAWWLFQLQRKSSLAGYPLGGG